MAKTTSYGPSGTPVGDPVITALTFPIAPLNFDADFGIIEEGVGKVVMTDITSPQDQPSTLRISQQAMPNVYAGSSIDSSVYLPNKKGTATVVEICEIWTVTDDTDPAFLLQFPVRGALTLRLPDSAYVTPASVERLVGRVVAGLFAQGSAISTTGLEAILHGIVKKD